jgi:exonuclease III
MTSNSLTILQYNLAKNKERSHSVLNHPDMKRFMIMALQEQYWSAYTDSSLTHYSWTLIESTAAQGHQPRSAIYINNTLINTSEFEPIRTSIDDVTAVAIKTAGNSKPTLIINVYHPDRNANLNPLKHFLLNSTQSNRYHATIVVGDFNLHHPLWNRQDYRAHDEKADELINIMMQNNMTLLLPPGTVTFSRGRTTIDLVWGSTVAEQSLIKCEATKYDHGSDHFPIQTTLSLELQQATNCTLPPYNYEETDWKELAKKMEIYLRSVLTSDVATPEDIDSYANKLVEATMRAVQETTFRKRISPHSKRWWKKELTLECRKVAGIRRKYQRTQNQQDKRKWKLAQQMYYDNIKNAKTEH